MCLGIPGRVIEKVPPASAQDVLMGKVDFGGVCKRVCLEHVPDVQVGQYVLVHVGFALAKIDEHEAQQVFDFLHRLNQLDELDVPQQDER
jgi:hydrogenase expression/formation protein HypC